MASEQPTLWRALDLQHRVLSAQVDVLGALSGGNFPGTADAGRIKACLTAGRPALHALDLDRVPLAASTRALTEVFRALVAAAGVEAARRAEEAVTDGTLDGPTLVRLALARDADTVVGRAREAGLAADVVWYAADCAASPLAHRLASLVTEATAGVAVAGWARGSCPICGSWPSLAEVFAGDVLLRCAFCQTAWQDRDRCAFCSEADPSHYSVVAPDPARPGRTLHLCRQCRGFVKAIEVAAPAPFPMVAVEDLASQDLDAAALRHGFRRPSAFSPWL